MATNTAGSVLQVPTSPTELRLIADYMEKLGDSIKPGDPPWISFMLGEIAQGKTRVELCWERVA